MDTHYRISLELTGTEDRIQLLLTGATGGHTRYYGVLTNSVGIFRRN